MKDGFDELVKFGEDELDFSDGKILVTVQEFGKKMEWSFEKWKDKDYLVKLNGNVAGYGELDFEPIEEEEKCIVYIKENKQVVNNVYDKNLENFIEFVKKITGRQNPSCKAEEEMIKERSEMLFESIYLRNIEKFWNFYFNNYYKIEEVVDVDDIERIKMEI